MWSFGIPHIDNTTEDGDRHTGEKNLGYALERELATGRNYNLPETYAFLLHGARSSPTIVS
jgi:hypothetical protein